MLDLQRDLTELVWGCGHTGSVRLRLDPVEAAEQIAAYTQIPCIECAIAARGICWDDLP